MPTKKRKSVATPEVTEEGLIDNVQSTLRLQISQCHQTHCIHGYGEQRRSFIYISIISIFFFNFLNWEFSHQNWGEKALFSIGNGTDKRQENT